MLNEDRHTFLFCYIISLQKYGQLQGRTATTMMMMMTTILMTKTVNIFPVFWLAWHVYSHNCWVQSVGFKRTETIRRHSNSYWSPVLQERTAFIKASFCQFPIINCTFRRHFLPARCCFRTFLKVHTSYWMGQGHFSSELCDFINMPSNSWDFILVLGFACSAQKLSEIRVTFCDVGGMDIYPLEICYPRRFLIPVAVHNSLWALYEWMSKFWDPPALDAPGCWIAFTDIIIYLYFQLKEPSLQPQKKAAENHTTA